MRAGGHPPGQVGPVDRAGAFQTPPRISKLAPARELLGGPTRAAGWDTGPGAHSLPLPECIPLVRPCLSPCWQAFLAQSSAAAAGTVHGLGGMGGQARACTGHGPEDVHQARRGRAGGEAATGGPIQKAPALAWGSSRHLQIFTCPRSSPESSRFPALYPVMARTFFTPDRTPRPSKEGSSQSRMTGSPL